MAAFAPVCPLSIFNKLLKYDYAGGYHLPLAHDVLKHPEEYRKIFHETIPRSPSRMVILDNSVIELGNSVDVNTIQAAADIVDANVIVLPDILRNCKETIRSCIDAYSYWGSVLKIPTSNYNLPGLVHRSFMFVPQGNTLQEFIRCAEALANGYPGIEWWGIPRNFNIQGLGSRRLAIDICHMLNPSRRIHLLGFSDNILDDMLSARDTRVSGIDSAVPLRAATLGMSMSLNLDQHLPPRKDWWDNPETANTSAGILLNNVSVTYDLCRGHR